MFDGSSFIVNDDGEIVVKIPERLSRATWTKQMGADRHDYGSPLRYAPSRLVVAVSGRHIRGDVVGLRDYVNANGFRVCCSA